LNVRNRRITDKDFANGGWGLDQSANGALNNKRGATRADYFVGGDCRDGDETSDDSS
jgi:hypothetical protein